jgi:hypothetical protein
MQRSSEEKQGARATVRLLESLLRLSEAHARLMCKQHVTLNDAIVAVYLMSLCQASYTGIKPPLHDCLLFRATELMYCSLVCAEMTRTLQSKFPEDSWANQQHIEERVMTLCCCSRDSIARHLASATSSSSSSARNRSSSKNDDDDDCGLDAMNSLLHQHNEAQQQYQRRQPHDNDGNRLVGESADNAVWMTDNGESMVSSRSPRQVSHLNPKNAPGHRPFSSSSSSSSSSGSACFATTSAPPAVSSPSWRGPHHQPNHSHQCNPKSYAGVDINRSSSELITANKPAAAATISISKLTSVYVTGFAPRPSGENRANNTVSAVQTNSFYQPSSSIASKSSVDVGNKRKLEEVQAQPPLTREDHDIWNGWSIDDSSAFDRDIGQDVFGLPTVPAVTAAASISPVKRVTTCNSVQAVEPVCNNPATISSNVPTTVSMSLSAFVDLATLKDDDEDW